MEPLPPRKSPGDGLTSSPSSQEEPNSQLKQTSNFPLSAGTDTPHASNLTNTPKNFSRPNPTVHSSSPLRHSTLPPTTLSSVPPSLASQAAPPPKDALKKLLDDFEARLNVRSEKLQRVFDTLPTLPSLPSFSKLSNLKQSSSDEPLSSSSARLRKPTLAQKKKQDHLSRKVKRYLSTPVRRPNTVEPAPPIEDLDDRMEVGGSDADDAEDEPLWDDPGVKDARSLHAWLHEELSDQDILKKILNLYRELLALHAGISVFNANNVNMPRIGNGKEALAAKVLGEDMVFGMMQLKNLARKIDSVRMKFGGAVAGWEDEEDPMWMILDEQAQWHAERNEDRLTTKGRGRKKKQGVVSKEALKEASSDGKDEDTKAPKLTEEAVPKGNVEEKKDEVMEDA
ncbi:hypothetical protein BS50DRAFT_640416 [Corynespora cassiicola Philippines]|uniref:Uncharacterized protein n=1 Tax=Corynespora cassiicola Philippines TaxID=1448308 RepID=A0A2T2N4N0_CORCC|nr:hypothetical protein BS50DRAFT_640416 [Corynespora cassiicola Philippines]